MGKISVILLGKISEKLAKHNPPIRCLGSTSSSKLKEMKRFLSPMMKVTLLPGDDDDDSNNLELSPVLSTLADLQTKQPSVTTIIKESESAEAAFRLQLWRRKMIKELGVAGFEQLQRETLARGTKFHSLAQQYFEEGIEPDFNEAPLKVETRLFLSAHQVLKRVETYITGEIFSTNPCLFYRGKIDSLVIIDGQVTLVEWKTSEKQKPTLASTYDAPLQTAAYIGALNRDKNLVIPGYTPLATPLPPPPLATPLPPPLATPLPPPPLTPSPPLATPLTPPLGTPLPPLATPLIPSPPIATLATPHLVTRAKIVVCYTDGSPATVLDLPLDVLQSYWPMWLAREITYWLRKWEAQI